MVLALSPSQEPHITFTDPYLSSPGWCSFYDDSPESQEAKIMDRWISPEHEQAVTFLHQYDAFSGKKAKHIAYAAIYEEISLLINHLRETQHRIIALKSRRNTLSSFFQLPDELMVEIWKYLARDADAIMIIEDRGLSIPAIFGVLQICSYWRRLALSTPILWTWLHTSWPRSIRHMLYYSRGCKLTLNVDLVTYKFVWLIQASDTLLSELNEAFQRATAVIFPQLSNGIQILNLLPPSISPTCFSQIRHVEATIQPSSALIPTQSAHFRWLIQNLPRLQTLILTEHTLFLPQAQSLPNAEPIIPRSITRLEICFAARAHPQLASIRSIVETLRQLPRLKRLVLKNVFSPLTEEDDSYCKELPRIKLPALSEISVLAGAATCNRFLGTIDATPLVKSITLDGLWDEKEFSYTMTLYNVFLKCALRIPHVEQLVFQEVGGKCIIQLYPSDKKAFALIPMSTRRSIYLLTHLKRAQRLRHVREIVYKVTFSDLAVWHSLNRRIFPRLDTIVFDPLFHPSFFRALAQIRGSSDTVFDPWQVELLRLRKVDLEERAKQPLYLTGVELHFIHTGAEPRKEHQSRQFFEEVSRLFAARESYRAYLRELARNIPDKESQEETESPQVEIAAGNSVTSLTDTMSGM